MGKLLRMSPSSHGNCIPVDAIVDVLCHEVKLHCIFLSAENSLLVVAQWENILSGEGLGQGTDVNESGILMFFQQGEPTTSARGLAARMITQHPGRMLPPCDHPPPLSRGDADEGMSRWERHFGGPSGPFPQRVGLAIKTLHPSWETLETAQ